MPDISKFLNYGIKQLVFKGDMTQITIDNFFSLHDTISEDTIIALAQSGTASTIGLAIGGYANSMAAIIREVMDVSYANGVFDATLKDIKNDPNEVLRWEARPDLSQKGRSCPDCAGRNGQEATLEEWEAMGFPSDGITLCGGKCNCKLVPVNQ